jgi:CRISPR-associated protein Cas1
VGWRTVVCRSVDTVSSKHGQLHLCPTDDGDKISVPIEDIDTLILENKATTITLASLQTLAQNQVNVIVCDKTNLPVASLTPLYQHSRSLDMLELQTGMTKPLKKAIWSRICKYKIENQARVLDQMNAQSEASKLRGILERVRSGDSTNQEAIAAGIYFKKLWPVSRRSPHMLNSLVNYGYSLIRTSLARYCAGFGLIPALGIHHHSSLNSFNLADDLLEPFRPLVDLLALHCLDGQYPPDCELSPPLKNEMLKMLSFETPMTGGLRAQEEATIAIICRLSCQSLIETIQKRDPSRLVLPEVTRHGAGE